MVTYVTVFESTCVASSTAVFGSAAEAASSAETYRWSAFGGSMSPHGTVSAYTSPRVAPLFGPGELASLFPHDVRQVATAEARTVANL